jgi:serine/threonine-protein phosphatase 2A regulatory subunit B'
MVYNAMKLFMEINPQLFDDCSHEYTEMQNSAEQRQLSRQAKWDKIAEQAKRRASMADNPAAGANGRALNEVNSTRVDEMDPITQDSQKRLNALKLQDESNVSKDRRQREQDRPNSVGCVTLPFISSYVAQFLTHNSSREGGTRPQMTPDLNAQVEKLALEARDEALEEVQ